LRIEEEIQRIAREKFRRAEPLTLEDLVEELKRRGFSISKRKLNKLLHEMCSRREITIVKALVIQKPRKGFRIPRPIFIEYILPPEASNLLPG